MATNEDIMDTLGILQSHIINVESALEEVKNSKQEAVEMNEYDRNAILNNMMDFERSLVSNIKDTIVQQQLELKSYNEEFYKHDVSDLGGVSGYWWIPARILNMDPADYILLLKEQFAPDLLKYTENGVLVFGWYNELACRKYKNWINKKAREVNFQC